MSASFVVKSDGGARGNPGPAGIGVVIENNGQVVAELSEYLGAMTNNQAEYRALIAALEKVLELGGQGSRVECVLDSELVVQQLAGSYRVKHQDLKPLYQRLQELVNELGGLVSFRAVPRQDNRHADQLANQAIDRATTGS